MSGNLIAIIVILVLLLVLAGIIYYAYCNIRKKLRDTSRMLFGTDSMICLLYTSDAADEL